MTILVPDTSALINLCDVYVGSTHIINVLRDLFDIQVPPEIVQEIRRHKADFLGFEDEFIQFARQTRHRFYRQNDYESVLLNHFSPSGNPNRNRGERYICCLALYRVRKRSTGQIIVLIDDLRAQRGLLSWYDKHFKTLNPWTSLDLLMHIYLVKFPKWPLAQALTALRSVNARVGGTEAARRLVRYRDHLRELHAMLGVLPRVRGVA